MTRVLYLFSSELERDAAFPEGLPNEALIRVSGVGLVDAAIGATRAIHEVRPDTVVFIGTCGAHRESGLVIGDVVYASTVYLSSGDVARGEMRMPALLETELSCDPAFAKSIAERVESSANRNDAPTGRNDAPTGRNVTPARVSSTLGITENDALAASIYDANRCDVENLEAFAVVRAAAAIPVAVILGVTNVVGVDGGRDWRTNYTTTMRRLAACLALGLIALVVGACAICDNGEKVTRTHHTVDVH